MYVKTIDRAPGRSAALLPVFGNGRRFPGGKEALAAASVWKKGAPEWSGGGRLIGGLGLYIGTAWSQEWSMAYVVAEPCIKCRYTDCVEVCPVDCFYEGPNFLVIHPDECIDCGACEPVCPTKAIFADDDLPEKWKGYVQLNAELSRRWPQITEKAEPLPDADRWKDVAEKRGELATG